METAEPDASPAAGHVYCLAGKFLVKPGDLDRLSLLRTWLSVKKLSGSEIVEGGSRPSGRKNSFSRNPKKR